MRLAEQELESRNQLFQHRRDEDREVESDFDPRNYKISDLGPMPTVTNFKKQRHDLEKLIGTIGPSSTTYLNQNHSVSTWCPGWFTPV